MKQLGCDVSVTKGFVVSQMRHQWGFNHLIGEVDKKDRTDHRHHAIDAVVIAATSRRLYTQAVKQIERDKLKIEPPYPDIRNELAKHLKQTIISHTSQRKLSGGLHEETGAGYIERHGGLVYRKNLSPELTVKNAKSIVDETVQELVLSHLANYDDDPKKAFADGVTLYHKDGKTPIKRVRVLQSKTTPKKLEQNKFGIKDKSGKVFKYMSYGNMHHVEILHHKKTAKYKGEFVTMMQASHRVKGIQSKLNSAGRKQAITKTEHGDEWKFVMALHINDLVSVLAESGERIFYRVQFLDPANNKFVLRANRAATLKKKEEELHVPIGSEHFQEYKLKTHKINAIGIITDD